nr:hypothetical protein [Morganella morganii]
MDNQKQAVNENAQNPPDTLPGEATVRKLLRITIIFALAAAIFWIFSAFYYAEASYMNEYMRGGFTYNEMGALLGYPEKKAEAKLYSGVTFVAGAVFFCFCVRAHLQYRRYRRQLHSDKSLT